MLNLGKSHSQDSIVHYHLLVAGTGKCEAWKKTLKGGGIVINTTTAFSRPTQPSTLSGM